MPTVLLSDAATEFVLSRQAALCAPSTVSFYERGLAAFERWANGKPLSNATAREFLGWKASQGLKPGAVHAYARALRAYGNFLLSEGLIAQALKVPMPRVGEPSRPCPTPEEVRRLLNSAKLPRDKALLFVLADSGIRLSEIAALHWEDFDAQTGELRLRHTKGNRARTVYLGYEARRALLRWKRKGNRGFLFGLTPAGVRQVLRRLSSKANVHVSAHMLRRYYATQSLTAGLPAPALQRALGHSSSAMTAIYVRLSDADMQSLMARSSPGDRLGRG